MGNYANRILVRMTAELIPQMKQEGNDMILKCKMCGGDMQIEKDQSCAVCEYCGTTVTIPKVDDERVLVKTVSTDRYTFADSGNRHYITVFSADRGDSS